ncbi:MAG: hypothetical protein A2Z96_06520 [Spirochaetes bacterium GWB1_48_6]|nr:MAG: hypothetical protein A2Z96_06520 [Spirochaetes bacterium GWB1_48_6]
MEMFFHPGVPAFMTTYRLEGKLIALGFLDESDQGLSSVYFIYGDSYQSRSLGTYSVLRECALVKEMGLAYYYLGYWVPGNSRMEYKHRFRPRELYKWNENLWCEEF